MKQYMIHQRGDSGQAVKQGWSMPTILSLGRWSSVLPPQGSLRYIISFLYFVLRAEAAALRQLSVEEPFLHSR